MTSAIKHIILWRHAEAELADIACSEDDDMARKLTPKGLQQAKRMARWLQKHLPKNVTLISSPAIRALQTAETLNYYIHVDTGVKPATELGDILMALNNIESPKSCLLLVGHQPWIGELVKHLTGYAGTEINIKKGAIWWLRQSSSGSSFSKIKLNSSMHLSKASYTIFTVQTPSLMR